MLDTTTKRRIDTARDILVGKIPDPKSQVEQITIALIYKFMDDMDAEAEELGGSRKFFADGFSNYGWARLMHSGLGGHEMLDLYAEAISRMPENPGIPPLFRSIFKNAYLPYRDPETLRSFLKIIDEFSYDHSERLGDAFEYLLSVLGSQGDAGQFRTPRHIIDFIVEILAPQKNETVLDPACGTAGFLISSYKHILKNNLDEKGYSTLTPDEKGRMVENFKGYDISPDMVRLSLVNLYLHGFSDPHIYEYDTLTSQERWNEYADVILANPPFMSPKGGIRPHNRFSVQSKRSEVLFVDYIADHLTPAGRAGVIVPEGIIFQSQNAYKQLRKKLVEESLVAVISLPAGVFQPYSGVKTSILIMDKGLSKKADTIAFFKVENDGFGLGAQRRPIDKNDLPRVLDEVKKYLDYIRLGDRAEEFLTNHGLVVKREKVEENGEYNLGGARYRESLIITNTFPMIRLGDICIINPRKPKLDSASNSTMVSFVPMAEISEKNISFNPIQEKPLSDLNTSYTYFENNDVLIAKVTPCFENGKAGIARNLLNGRGFGSSEFYVIRSNEQTLPEWIYYCVKHEKFRKDAIAQMTGTGGLQRVPRSFIENYHIPLPPMEIQKEIVAEIESYQKVIDGARAVVENYRPRIPIDPTWPLKRLPELAENLDSLRIPITKEDRKKGPFPYYGASGIVDYVESYIFDEDILLISEDGANLLARVTPIAFSVFGKCWVNNHAHVLRFQNIATQKYVEYYLNSISIAYHVTGAAQPKLNQQALNKIEIPIPTDLPTIEAIIDGIKTVQTLINANRELIELFKNKIESAIDRVWLSK